MLLLTVCSAPSRVWTEIDDWGENELDGGMVAILWSSLWVVVWACLCTTLEASHAGMTARSSDPNVQHGEGGQIFSDPNNLPDLALGRPDSIETDTPGPPLSPKDFEESGIMTVPHLDYLSASPTEHNTIDTSVQADPIELAGLFQGDIMLNRRDTLSDLAHGMPSRE
ncbi:hypothetical protein O3P69_002142 [Scylla paramamosain]|uniref:Uncharacterized protein n=1 Tax=Scylla paramamosain TaxID=85552 RepID=A0AAW0V4Z9_SCYPA